MCGIAGFLNLPSSQSPVNEPILIEMRDSMLHRGPDGGGVWLAEDQQVGLAHRRLSIIDLSGVANQPMSNEDDSLFVVFNGEIYNHREIRLELERRGGHRWKTDHSDTEVILHAFEEWGIDCLERFRGMFAIALWDARKRELWLIRDRLGIKPLVYTIHEGTLLFASEIKALLKVPGVRRAVDETSLFHYLSFLTAPAPDTLFENIHKLSPGTWLRMDREGQVLERRYWDVLDHARPFGPVDESVLLEKIREELETAVAYRKVSDVPVGVFLSGGIDSTTNAALFSKGEGGPVKAFSIGYEEDYGSYQNELHHARFAAESVGAEYFERRLTQKDLMDFLPQMIYLQDEPIADPVCVPVYYVSKLARDNGVIVCQVGEGADELFFGYPTWKLKLRLQLLNDRFRVPGWMKSGGLSLLRMLGQGDKWPYEALRRSSLDQPVFWGGAESFTEPAKRRLLSRRLREKFRNYSSWEALKPLYDRFQERCWEPSAFHWMTYVDLNMRLPELLLMRVDKMSMGVSLECRVPFLDHEFVTLAMSIPTQAKTKELKLKYLLKKAVRGLIPDRIIDRPKQGFGVPVYEWLQQELGDRAEESILNFVRQTDLLDETAVRGILKNRRAGGAQTWYLLNLALWWEAFIKTN